MRWRAETEPWSRDRLTLDSVRPLDENVELALAYLRAPGAEVVVAHLDEAVAPEARLMSAVHDGDRQRAQPLHGLQVGIDVRPLELVEQRAVVDRVSREQDPGLGLPQTDAARRVPGKVHDLERAVADVDDVAVVEQACCGCTGDLTDHRHANGRHRVDQELGDVVARVAVRPQHGLAVVLRDEGRLLRLREHPGLDAMDRPVGELGHAADVVGVHVRGDGEHRVIELMLHEVRDRHQPERRVDHEVAVTAAHVPDVAAQQRVDVRLGDQRDTVTDGAGDEPGIGDGQLATGHEGNYAAPGCGSLVCSNR